MSLFEFRKSHCSPPVGGLDIDLNWYRCSDLKPKNPTVNLPIRRSSIELPGETRSEQFKNLEAQRFVHVPSHTLVVADSPILVPPNTKTKLDL